MTPPTARQAECLAAIRRLTVQGVRPSLGQLAAELGLTSGSSVHPLLRGLADRGLIRWRPYKARSIEIVGDEWSHLEMLSSADLQALRIRVDILLAERAPT